MLVFGALAWLKLQFLCHAGETEVGGFGVSAADSLLHVEDFVTVRQTAGIAGVEFDDEAVADHFDRCVDGGIPPERCGRIWLHTHPGDSPNPSGTDEETFGRVFGKCDWAIMFIVSRTGRTYARLALSSGPVRQMLLPVTVDWSSWPAWVADEKGYLLTHLAAWRREYAENVVPVERIVYPGVLDDNERFGRPQCGFGDWFDWVDELQEVPVGEGVGL